MADDDEGRVENQETSSTIVSNVAGGRLAQKASSTKKGSKGKDASVGEKRKRTTFTVTQKVYLQQALVKGDLDTIEKRQRVAQTFAIESGNPSQADSIHNWYRNNKSKKSKEGECAGTG